MLVMAPVGWAADAGESIVVTATRTRVPLNNTAAALSRFDADDLLARQAQSIGDALQDVPNVTFGGGPRVAGRTPSLRGFSGREVTLLVDGVRMTAASDLTTPAYIDPWLLDQAEVLRGNSSSLYGSGGLGGVISLGTASAASLLPSGKALGAEARLARDQADSGRQLQVRGYGRHAQWDVLAAFSGRDGSDIRQGGGTRLAPNDNRSQQSLLKIGYQLLPDWHISLNHRRYHERATRTNNPQVDTALDAGAPVQRQQVDQVQTRIGLQQQLAGGAGLSAQWYQTYLEQAAEPNPDQFLPASDSRVQTQGGGVQQVWLWGGHRVSLGVDGHREQQRASFAGQANPVMPKGRQTVTGLFWQDEWQLDPTWSLTPSVRYDRYQTEVQGGQQAAVSHHHWSPKLTLGAQLSPAWRLWASVGEAYRAPTLSETYQHLRCNNCLFNFAANPDLKPETDRSMEWGANYWGRNWLTTGDRLLLRANWFQSRTQDLISSEIVGFYDRAFPFDGEGLIFQYQNQSRAKRQGVELEASWRYAPWQIDVAYGRLRVKNPNTGAQLYAPPDKLIANLGWQQGDWQGHWRTRMVAAQSYDSTVARRTAGYSTHDAWLQWQPGALPGTSLSLGVTNLGDKRYVVYETDNPSARAVEAGRAWKLSAGYRF